MKIEKIICDATDCTNEIDLSDSTAERELREDWITLTGLYEAHICSLDCLKAYANMDRSLPELSSVLEKISSWLKPKPAPADRTGAA